MGNATSAGLGSEAPHDERDIVFVRGHNSDTRPDDIELAEEAKRSEVINSSNLDNESPKLPAKFYSGAQAVGLEVKSREAVPLEDRYEVKANEVTMCPEVSSSREDGEGSACVDSARKRFVG